MYLFFTLRLRRNNAIYNYGCIFCNSLPQSYVTFKEIIIGLTHLITYALKLRYSLYYIYWVPQQWNSLLEHYPEHVEPFRNVHFPICSYRESNPEPPQKAPLKKQHILFNFIRSSFSNIPKQSLCEICETGTSSMPNWFTEKVKLENNREIKLSLKVITSMKFLVDFRSSSRYKIFGRYKNM